MKILIVTDGYRDHTYNGYKHTFAEIGDEYADRIIKIANAISNSKNAHNWEYPFFEYWPESLTEEEIDWFDDLIPQFVFTVKNIHILDIVKTLY